MLPLRIPTTHGADSQPTGEPSFWAEAQEAEWRAGSDRSRVAACKAPRLGITQKRDMLFGPATENFQKNSCF